MKTRLCIIELNAKGKNTKKYDSISSRNQRTQLANDAHSNALCICLTGNTRNTFFTRSLYWSYNKYIVYYKKKLYIERSYWKRQENKKNKGTCKKIDERRINKIYQWPTIHSIVKAISRRIYEEILQCEFNVITLRNTCTISDRRCVLYIC